MQQVHDCKGNFVHYVNPAQRRVEFNTVKRGGLSANERNIAKMQITVALAYETLHVTLFKAVLAIVIFGLQRLVQRGYAGFIFFRHLRQPAIALNFWILLPHAWQRLYQIALRSPAQVIRYEIGQ